jgi:RNA polymerase sigma-70 factor (ECF subfamily)
MALPLSDPVGGLRMGYSFELTRYLASPILTSDQALTDFLKSVEKRAFKRTAFTVRDDDSALDIVQDAMIRLAERYADRPSQEWPLLFQRILANATMDWFRRQKVRNALFSSIEELESSDDDPAFDLLEYFATGGGGSGTESAEDGAYRSQVMMIIESEVSELPARQREAFLLRYWEEMDVAETAQVMGCSEGSVKTHCSRAVNTLAKALKARGIVL